jgi:hypothetical protein
VPPPGASVQVRSGHTVLYDVNSTSPVRMLHVAGTLQFASDRDTRLDVGLIRIEAGDNAAEDGFVCDAHMMDPDPSMPRPALLVGTPSQPIDSAHTALIRLAYFDGMDQDSLPAIVCCGGRMEFHGAPMNRTWVKLGATAKPGDTAVRLTEPVTGWRIGDRVIITITSRAIKGQDKFQFSVISNTQTEERTVTAIDASQLTLDRPLEFTHLGDGLYRGEVANLSRNVIVESADTAHRGHTMYHRGSAGSIGYAEFRHLGKQDVLGRYSIHFHLVGATMRGSSVIGASVWDSANRWITIHGTNYLVVRDCVGYRSVGHGFFLEDGTEVFNVLDRNLAVQAIGGRPLPNQVLPFDRNDGAGFWWANSMNSFVRNVACECDQYGFRFEAVKSAAFDTSLSVQQADGTAAVVDIRTLAFVRFEDNESHAQRIHAFNLGGLDANQQGGVAGVGPDAAHPFVVRNMRAWDSHWAFHFMTPSLMVDGYDMHTSEYGLWKPVYNNDAFRGLTLSQISVSQEFQPVGKRPVESDYPNPLAPIDDLPPVTVITSITTKDDGSLLVRGSAADNTGVAGVSVNGVDATPLVPDFSQWEAIVDPVGTVTAFARDVAGNIEPVPHVVALNSASSLPMAAHTHWEDYARSKTAPSGNIPSPAHRHPASHAFAQSKSK